MSFWRELLAIREHIKRERGFPTFLLRLEAARFVTGKEDADEAREAFKKYLAYLCEPNLILNFPPEWLPEMRQFAKSDAVYDQLSEDLCELLKRHYTSYESAMRIEKGKKSKKSS